MKNWGIFLITVSLIGLIIGFSLKSSVRVEKYDWIGGERYSSYNEVENIGLLNQKQNIIITSGFFLIMGTVIFSFGVLIEKQLPKNEIIHKTYSNTESRTK